MLKVNPALNRMFKLIRSASRTMRGKNTNLKGLWLPPVRKHTTRTRRMEDAYRMFFTCLVHASPLREQLPNPLQHLFGAERLGQVLIRAG